MSGREGEQGGGRAGGRGSRGEGEQGGGGAGGRGEGEQGEGEQGVRDVPLPSPFPPCQGLSRVRDGLLVGEIDLNLVRQVRDKWSFPVSALGAGGVFRLDPPPPPPPPPPPIPPQMTMRLDMYAKELSDACKHDFKPQAVYEPSN